MEAYLTAIRDNIPRIVIAACIVALAAIGWWGKRPKTLVEATAPRGIMGTECMLRVVVPAGERATAARALKRAEDALRRVEARMSTWLADSEVSQLNGAPPGKIEPSEPLMAVLRAAKRMAGQTDGAFDATAGPLFDLWKHAGRTGRLPAPEQLTEARRGSGWQHFELLPDGVRKLEQSARVDLDGIAKGYAIDRASEAMRNAGAIGGLVNVGGDIRCFGVSPDGKGWLIGIRDPFSEARRAWKRLRIPAGAVCTSGNYARPIEIDGRRYSHIIDPRTLRPADMSPSVTVIAPDTMTADAWATALSVLGPDGLERLPEDPHIDVMFVTGTPESPQIVQTPTFARYLASETPGDD